jgi:hypothetical protein
MGGPLAHGSIKQSVEGSVDGNRVDAEEVGKEPAGGQTPDGPQMMIRATVLRSATAGPSPEWDHSLMQPIAMQRRKRDDVVDQKFIL